MTVYTLSARPGRQDPGAAGQRPPVPWPQMLWVTWRQHRGLLVSVLVTCCLAVTGLLAEGWKIHRDYAVVAACHPAAAPACLGLSNGFNTDWHVGNGIRVAVLVAPVLLALFAGAPVVARELENGTFRYAWTQGIGRIRWTAAKLAILGFALAVTALAVSLLFTWFFTPFLLQQHLTPLDPAVFDTRAPVYAAWTLTAFCLGAFLGTLLRRVIAAMAVTPTVFFILAALVWDNLFTHNYPAGAFWPAQCAVAGGLLALAAVLAVGTLRLVRRHAA